MSKYLLTPVTHALTEKDLDTVLKDIFYHSICLFVP